MSGVNGMLSAARIHPNHPQNITNYCTIPAKPWSILKSKYRFIPWYEKDAA